MVHLGSEKHRRNETDPAVQGVHVGDWAGSFVIVAVKCRLEKTRIIAVMQDSSKKTKMYLDMGKHAGGRLSTMFMIHRAALKGKWIVREVCLQVLTASNRF